MCRILSIEEFIKLKKMYFTKKFSRYLSLYCTIKHCRAVLSSHYYIIVMYLSVVCLDR